MEMEYHHEGRRRKVLIVLGVVLAVAAGGAAFFLVNQAQNAGTGVVATRDVVVAARDIPARTVIQSSDLTIRAVPDDPSLAVAIASPEDAIGRITGVGIPFQHPISPNLPRPPAPPVVGGRCSAPSAPRSRPRPFRPPGAPWPSTCPTTAPWPARSRSAS